MDRLTVRINERCVIPKDTYHSAEERKAILNKLAYYEDLEEQGRLIILPCKVGTRIYRIVPDFSICWPDPPKNKVIWDTFKIEDIYEFEKTVFLTREEAETTMKK